MYQRALQLLLDLLFPKQSLSHQRGEWITEREMEEILQACTPLLFHANDLQKMKMSYIDTLFAATTYHATPLLKKALHRYKYDRIQSVHQQLGNSILRTLDEKELRPSTNRSSTLPILCPVPLHWTRLYWRGFNQATVLAQDIGAAKDWQVQELLLRTRRTGSQMKRKRSERLTALSGAFAYDKKINDPPSWVILVDDVCTTGTTLNECAKTLKENGVETVSALVLAYDRRNEGVGRFQ